MSIEIKEYDGFKPTVKKPVKPVNGSKDSNKNKDSNKDNKK